MKKIYFNLFVAFFLGHITILANAYSYNGYRSVYATQNDVSTNDICNNELISISVFATIPSQSFSITIDDVIMLGLASDTLELNVNSCQEMTFENASFYSNNIKGDGDGILSIPCTDIIQSNPMHIDTFISSCEIDELKLSTPIINQCESFSYPEVKIQSILVSADMDTFEIETTQSEEIVFTAIPVGTYQLTQIVNLSNSDGKVSVSEQVGIVNILPNEFNQGIICNNNLNISLTFNVYNDGCQKPLLADDLIENIPDCAQGITGMYRIGIFDNKNTDLGDVIDATMVGKDLHYKIQPLGSTNYCWGKLNIEDKSLPSLECKDVTIYCTNPVLNYENLLVKDNHNHNTTLTAQENLIASYEGCEDKYYGESFNSIKLRTNNKYDTIVVAYKANGSLVYETTLNGQIAYDLFAIHHTETHSSLVEGEFYISSQSTSQSSNDIELIIERGVALASMLELHSCAPDFDYEIVNTTFKKASCNDGVQVGGTYERLIRVKNNNGLYTECTQTINVITPTFADIDVPSNDSKIACSDVDFDISTINENNSGQLISPSFLNELNSSSPIAPNFGCEHFPTGANTVCNISYTYSDIVFNACKGVKIVRTWTLVNTCTETIKEYHQNIVIDDVKAPTLKEAYQNKIIQATSNQFDCYSDFSIKDIFEDGCSSIKRLQARYDIKDIKTGNTNTIIVNALEDNITRLGYGEHSVFVQATDECGNESEEIELTIVYEDNVDPIAIINKEVNVTVSNNGEGWLKAEALNEGSYDNCGIQTIEVRRVDGENTSDWSTKGVKYDCSDIGNKFKVELRVIDINKNQATSWGYVTVEDGIALSISCPEDFTISCTELNRSGLEKGNSLYGLPDVSSVCSATNFEYLVVEDLNNCQEGTIKRQWIYSGGHKNGSDTCTQTITVTTTNDWTVTFPEEEIIVSCQEELPSAEHLVVETNGCENILVKCDTVKMASTDGACARYEITYTAINSCVFNQNKTYDSSKNDSTGKQISENVYTAGDDGIISCTQTIIVQDQTLPTINCKDPIQFEEPTTSCEGKYALTIDASDICSSNLTYRISIDANQNGVYFESADINVNDKKLGGLIAFGNYTAKYLATDECGNTATCIQEFSVIDSKAPTPICYANLSTAIMPETGQIQLDASHFIKDAVDNCTDTETLMASVEGRVVGRGSWSKNFTIECLDILTNPVVVVQIRVTDNAGNKAFCTSTLIVRDNDGVCPQLASATTASIAGQITTVDGKIIPDVVVKVNETNEDFNTARGGLFAFQDLPTQENYTLSAKKTDDITNGVSVADIIYITRHILGSQEFETNHQYLAADVDRSGNVSVSDILSIRQAILRKTNGFSNNDSWLFIDKNEALATELQHTLKNRVSESIELNNLLQSNTALEMTGIKMGDVNGDAQVVDSPVQSRNGNVLRFNIEDKLLEAGTTHTVVLNANEFKNIMAYQFTMNFDTEALELIDLESQQLTVREEDFNLERTSEGQFSTAFASANEVNLNDGEGVFGFTFNVKRDIRLQDALYISNDMTQTIAYSQNATTQQLDASNIALEFVNETPSTNTFELYQNRPNPVNGTTIIGFDLPKAQSANLTIYDINGKKLMNFEKEFVAGRNEIELSSNKFPISGVWYYELSTEGYHAIKKMVVIK